MEMQYFREYSDYIGHDMECKVYGHAGKPMIFIPCQDGRFFDFENFKMIDVFGPWIEAGELMVLAIDTMDKETWSNPFGDPGHRSWLYEQWIQYITEEMVPFIQDMACERNGWDERPGVMVYGASLGATHAANLYFRRPDLFDRLMSLSGIYSAEYGFGSFMDERVYNNSPVHFLPNMPEDHPYIQMYNERKAVICCGQGPWEYPEYTRQLQNILESKGIHAWVDFWGFDCAHDWDWWYKQVVYFLPYLLSEEF